MAQYCTIDEAQEYFDGELETYDWDVSNDTQRNKALIKATRMIDNLNFAGAKTVSTQELEFPRDDDTEVPTAIKYACAACAIMLLGGFDIEKERNRINISSESFQGMSTKYNNILPEHIEAGIPSSFAWDLLRPYIVNPRSIVIAKS